MAGERVPYHLRQNKHVERELFLDLLANLGRRVRWKDYLYIGFGGAFFEDFKVLHTRLGINQMLSVEYSWHVFLRQENNVPYGCIQREQVSSGDLIQRIEPVRWRFEKAKSALIWLDYTDAKRLGTQMDEIRALLPRLRRYDVLKVTFNANPATLGDLPAAEQGGQDLQQRRLDHRIGVLRARLGKKFPGSTKAEDIKPANYPKWVLSVLKLEVSEAMKESPDLVFQPIGCFAYADSDHTMVTCTGIMLTHAERLRFVTAAALKKNEFASLNWEVHKIDIPYLSAREKLLLDTLLFNTSPEQIVNLHGMWFNEEAEKAAAMISDYAKFYRFYPHYHRVQY
jgi:hypothetical protein